MQRLAEMRVADRQRTYTHLGPHRDDFRLVRNGLDMRDCASQGEQRAALLTLVLAEWEYQCGTQNKPLLLLDDVMSELDEGRRKALVSVVRTRRAGGDHHHRPTVFLPRGPGGGDSRGTRAQGEPAVNAGQRSRVSPISHAWGISWVMLAKGRQWHRSAPVPLPRPARRLAPGRHLPPAPPNARDPPWR